jgi:L-threonylcarbamoyladenylate synthase
VQALAAGRAVGLPTETVYGLACDGTRTDAVAQVYAAKARPQFNPLITHVPDLASVRRLAVVCERAEALARAFWPGPLTLVLEARPDCLVTELARAGLPTLAVRVPAHPVAEAVLQAFGQPLVAPSANRSGHVSPTEAAHVAADFAGAALGQAVPVILDGGPATRGLESTILRVPTDPNAPLVRLRKGSLSAEALDALGLAWVDATPGGAVAAPGMQLRHYAPAASLRLNATSPGPDELYLAFGPVPLGARGISLSEGQDVVEAASRLYAALRALDAQASAQGLSLAVAPVPDSGLGEAINDRLTRAARGRA